MSHRSPPLAMQKKRLCGRVGVDKSDCGEELLAHECCYPPGAFGATALVGIATFQAVGKRHRGQGRLWDRLTLVVLLA